MTSDIVGELADILVKRATAARVMVVTAESCTGGMVAAAITDVAGASAVLDRGLVTYSNNAKQDLLGVPTATLDTHGAVSMETAVAMAEGALAASPQAGLAVAITGIAGPGGGSAEKPVGLVWFGVAESTGETRTARHVFSGDRTAIRRQAVATALTLLADALSG
ncbi:MAG: CinA family protein [Pseudomonadota bacterium]|nr:CinA family protein [Pseudomonadota bacterium]